MSPMMINDIGLNTTAGIKKLVSIYREQFRIPENLDYYTNDDYKRAERKFIKFALQDGQAPILSDADD